MPERIATSDPFKQISDYVRSEPMRFVKSEWALGPR
jgi:peptide/nickel transport system substrate-binding protein